MKMLSFRVSEGGFGDFCVKPSGRAESVDEEGAWTGAVGCILPTDVTSCYSSLLLCGPLHSLGPAYLRALAPAVPVLVPASPEYLPALPPHVLQVLLKFYSLFKAFSNHTI